MKIRKRNFKTSSEIQNFWPSFTDVMSTITLILFLILLIAFIQLIVSGSSLENTQKKLQESELKLHESKIEIAHSKDELKRLQDDAEAIRAELERGKIELKLSRKEIEDQKKVIAMSNEELGNLRSSLQDVAVLRLDILEKVKDSIEKEMGSENDNGEPLVTISDNANIIINENLVFDYDSYTLRSGGKELLKQLGDAFERVLNDPNTRRNIDAIVIQGHTDYLGDSDYNRELSTKRATVVVNYMMKVNKNLEHKYGRYFAATGYSEFRPITLSKNEKEMKKNRRIEISINIKDSSIQDIIQEYLDETEKMLEE